MRTEMRFRATEPERCWIGVCAGCGRTLISATWDRGNGGTDMAMLGYRHNRPVFCTARCRQLHEHHVEPRGETALKRLRRAQAWLEAQDG